MQPFLRATLFVLATASAGAATLAAQISERPVRPTCAPCLTDARCLVPECPPAFAGAQRISSHIRASMDGRIIRYEIDDRYVNRSGRVAEVDYILPLPKGAAFESLELSINGEMIAGETMRAERARAVYEEIVRKLRDPALVEWMGHDMLRTRIFPIQPGEEKRVVVRFSAVAQREGDALRLDWPARAAMTIGSSCATPRRARARPWARRTRPRTA
jgi:Ca-activated chloride channel family protein